MWHAGQRWFEQNRGLQRSHGASDAKEEKALKRKNEIGMKTSVLQLRKWPFPASEKCAVEAMVDTWATDLKEEDTEAAWRKSWFHKDIALTRCGLNKIGGIPDDNCALEATNGCVTFKVASQAMCDLVPIA